MKPKQLVSLGAIGATAIATGGIFLATGAGATPAAHHANNAKTKTITAVEQEYSIKLSKTKVSPGKYTFIAKNVGSETHGLVVDGPGVDKTSSYVQPGHSVRLTVTLKKGSYDIYCPVTGHKMLGMNTHLKVS